MSLEKIEKFLKTYETIMHEHVPHETKLKSLVESGIKDKSVIDMLLKMKHGALTKVKLALDNDNVSDCIYEFRLLTSREQIEIDDEMMKLPYIQGVHQQYDLYYFAKTLSKANKSIVSNFEFLQPELKETDILTALPVSLLLAIGMKYMEFRDKVSPRLEVLTEADVTEIINAINKEETMVKKLELLNGLSSKSTQEALISLVNRLVNIQQQLAQYVIGI